MRAGRVPDVTASTTVAREPHVVWSALADPARITAWSPESSAVSARGSTPLPVGSTFGGSNRHGIFRWTTRCTVVESAPGDAFAFDVTYLRMGVARWRYTVTPEAGGTRVEDQWTDHRGAVMRILGTLGTGVRDRRSHNERTMRATLDALTTELEAS